MLPLTELPSASPKTHESVDKSATRVRSMFASIADRYDFLNHFLSLGIDRSWRKRVIREAPPRPGSPVLDCCTGTADLAIAYAKLPTKPIVIGADFCRPMLKHALTKIRKSKLHRSLALVEADAQRLPWPDATFGVATVAFGIRNVANTTRGIDELIRVLKPGGKLAILEFSRPRGPLAGRLYMAFFRHLLPRIGQAVAPNPENAYAYLPQSVMEFPDGQAMVDLLHARGLVSASATPLTFGIATIYTGQKPGANE